MLLTLIGVVFVVVSLLLILLVLLQKGRGGGLGAAFGGAGSSAFGTRTGDVLTWVTIVLTAMFLLLAVVATLQFRPPPSTVRAPTVSNIGPEIEGPIDVVVDCRTPGARIAFTTDGGDPKEEKAGRTGVKVTVKPGMTLKVQAYRKRWESSKVVSVTYVQKTASAAAPPANAAPPDAAPAPVADEPATAPAADAPVAQTAPTQ